jgi:hypothetical protein
MEYVIIFDWDLFYIFFTKVPYNNKLARLPLSVNSLV